MEKFALPRWCAVLTLGDPSWRQSCVAIAVAKVPPETSISSVTCHTNVRSYGHKENSTRSGDDSIGLTAKEISKIGATVVIYASHGKAHQRNQELPCPSTMSVYLLKEWPWIFRSPT